MLIEFSFGLIFWMTISFLAVLFILGKFAWKPIMKALEDRERNIEESLGEAERARAEIASMNAQNEALMREAREEREVLLREAREIRDKEIANAKERAKSEADALLTRAREDIRNEKMAAIAELKSHVAELSVEMAERILRTELADSNAQKALVQQMLNEADLKKS
jgi:F-type H+-transporting ATPase subunit b